MNEENLYEENSDSDAGNPESESDGQETENSEIDEISGEESGEQRENERLLKENADLRDKVLRTLAELENTRRRSTEEKDRAVKFALVDFVRDLIVVMENFYRAMDSVGDGEKDGEFKVFHEGIEMTFSELRKIFDKNSVKRIYPMGEQFDPKYHEAITSIESNNASGTVAEVMQAGYLLNGRVIRPALVVVVK
jgi:molecular chaperone GrpE